MSTDDQGMAEDHVTKLVISDGRIFTALSIAWCNNWRGERYLVKGNTNVKAVTGEGGGCHRVGLPSRSSLYKQFACIQTWS